MPAQHCLCCPTSVLCGSRHFIKEDQDPAWDSSGKDELSEAGYNMIPIVSGQRMLAVPSALWSSTTQLH